MLPIKCNEKQSTKT